MVIRLGAPATSSSTSIDPSCHTRVVANLTGRSATTSTRARRPAECSRDRAGGCLTPTLGVAFGASNGDRPGNRGSRDSNPVHLWTFPDRRGGACCSGPLLRRRRPRRDAQSQAQRPSSGGRHCLLLVSRGCHCLDDRSRHHALAGPYRPIRTWRSVVRCRHGRSYCSAARRLVANAPHRHGSVLRPVAHCVLRGQRPASAPVAVSASICVLARSKPHRRSNSPSRTHAPSAGSTARTADGPLSWRSGVSRSSDGRNQSYLAERSVPLRFVIPPSLERII